MILFRVKYPYQNTQREVKYHRRKKQEPVGMKLCAISSAQENPPKCDSAVFRTNTLKSYFFLYFLIALNALARTSHMASVPSLLNIRFKNFGITTARR